MKTIAICFAAKRYWPDEEALQRAFASASERLGEAARSLALELDCRLIQVPADGSALPAADCLIAVPMSGAVQREVLAAAAQYQRVVLYGAYIRGNADEAACEGMLRCNAAPTLMDSWAVLRRTGPRVQLALDAAGLCGALRLLRAEHAVRRATLLQIGQTEPWVISNASSPRVYEERFGLTVRQVSQEELAGLYRQATRDEAAPYHDWFTRQAAGCVEPTADGLWDAARMAWALHTLLRRYDAQGAAIACFALLREGTTACLGVSYINDCTPMVAACEGDLDSAVTMLLMKQLTGGPVWMANPGLQPDGGVNFSHCTAPLRCGGALCPYTLRSHHESGIGVSLQVEYPAGIRLTACRVSNEASEMTIHTGRSVPGPYEAACRTQLHLQFDDPAHYLDTALGCHQVFVFEECAPQLRRLAGLFGLAVL